METKDVIREVSELRKHLEEIKIADDEHPVHINVTPNTRVSWGVTPFTNTISCRRVAIDGSSLKTDTEMIKVKINNVTTHVMDTSQLDKDHEYKRNPRRVALVEVEAGEGKIRTTLAGFISHLGLEQKPILVGHEDENTLLVFDVPEHSFAVWMGSIMSEGEEAFGVYQTGVEEGTGKYEEEKEPASACTFIHKRLADLEIVNMDTVAEDEGFTAEDDD